MGKCAESFEGVDGWKRIRKKMRKEKVCWSSVMKKSCEWQTLGFIRKRKEKSLIVWVDMKQNVIPCL